MLKVIATSASLTIAGSAFAHHERTVLDSPLAVTTFVQPQQNQPERTEEARRFEHDARLRESIAEFRGLGVKVSVAHGITIGSDNEYIFAPEKPRILDAVIASTPLSYLENYSAATRDLPPQLRPADAVKIYALSLSSSRKDDTISINIKDHLLGDVPYTLQVNTKDFGQKDLATHVRKEVFDTIVKILRERAERHAEELKKIEPNREARPLVELVPVEKGSSGLAELAKSNANLVITIVNPRRTAEETVTLRLSSKDLEKAGNSVLRCNGSIQVIVINVQGIPAEIDRRAKKVNGEALDITLIDKQGNHYTQSWITFLGISNRADKNLIITPRLAFKDDPAAAGTFEPVKINLSWLGGNPDTVLFEQPFIVPIMTVGPYKICGDLHHSAILNTVKDNLLFAVQGSVTVEKFFGFEPGTLQKRIVVVDSDYENGHYKHSNPNTTFLNDESLIHPSWALTISRHETFHLVDHEIGTEISSGLFQEQFERLAQANSTFFQAINESNFLSGLTLPRAGHAQDNSTEFFASFMNGLIAEDWETRMTPLYAKKVKCSTFFADYRDTIVAVQKTINTIPNLKADAPIRSLLERRLSTVNQLITSGEKTP